VKVFATVILRLPVPDETPAAEAIKRDWHKSGVALIERLPTFLIVLLFLFLLSRVALFFVHRLQRIAERDLLLNSKRSAQLRTIATIVRATSFSVLGFLLFLQILTLFNIDYRPLLASAGIVGVGIGLAAQSLFKDIINGIFILVEDQYNVGDVIKAAGLQGTVEDLTLRLTRVRDGDGTLYVIPNSQIATVSNLSRDFAVANLPVAVDASANPDQVIALLNDIAASVRQDPRFKDVILSDATVLGVDKIDGRSILYPILIRVRPNQKDGVLRELRRRIVLTFEAKGIPLGSDSSLLIMQTAKDPTAPPAQQPLT
jgi:small-conductance mechanosensitive channel